MASALVMTSASASASAIDLIYKWLAIHYSFVLVQISLPSLTLEQEFFSI